MQKRKELIKCEQSQRRLAGGELDLVSMCVVCTHMYDTP